MAKEFSLNLLSVDHAITITAHSQGTLTVANAAAIGDATYIFNIELHIGSALNSGLTTYRYVAPVAAPAATLITK